MYTDYKYQVPHSKFQVSNHLGFYLELSNLELSTWNSVLCIDIPLALLTFSCYHVAPMQNKNRDLTILQKGAISLSTILTVTLVIVGLYLIFKVNTHEERIKAVETKVGQGVTAQQGEQNAPLDFDKVKALFKKGNIVLGDANKVKTLIVEFSDPSCPFCNVAAGADQTIAESMDPQGKRFVWKENGGTYEPPLPEIKKLVDEGKAAFVQLYANGHGAGEIASQALYCAHDEGKFWEAHDLLYTKAGYDLINDKVKNDVAQSSLMAEYLSTATDQTKMETCLSSGKYANKLKEDMATAQEMGFSGTPMFIVNTQKFPGAYSFADMKPAIDAALK